MQIVRDWRDLPDALKGAAVAVGAFDGVHRGHQAVIASAREAADRLGVSCLLYTSDAADE